MQKLTSLHRGTVHSYHECISDPSAKQVQLRKTICSFSAWFLYIIPSCSSRLHHHCRALEVKHWRDNNTSCAKESQHSPG
jgi:hypothetical protein